MKYCFLFVAFFTTAASQAQTFRYADFIHMLSTGDTTEAMFNKKKYFFCELLTMGDTVLKLYSERQSFKKHRQKEYIPRITGVGYIGSDPVVSYTTPKNEEFISINNALVKHGFIFNKAYDSCPANTYFIQNSEYTVTTKTFLNDTVVNYQFLFHKKNMQGKSEVHFAEDLLQYDSHEYLKAVFGAMFVKRDIYYFSDDDLSKCSVIFPGTSLQAVFLWTDEVNLKGLKAILLGGQDLLRKPSDNSGASTIEVNRWKLRDNIYVGMELHQLVKVNGEDFEFFAGNTKYTGLIKPVKTGSVRFDSKELVLSCTNCNSSSFFRERETMYAKEAVRRDLMMYLLSITLYPEQKK
jgi:hypothetical protein